MATETEADRLKILKTYKLFIGGKFPRTESGRYAVAKNPEGEHVANYCKASRKDLRDAVRAARGAQSGWAKATAYLRGQIIYRIGEMVEGRAAQFVEELEQAGLSTDEARREVAATVDRLVYYAGWSDKFDSVFGSVNPVASPHWNVTSSEPMGVVGLICPDQPGLLSLATLTAVAVVSGNAVVALASEKTPLPSITFAEAIATSDVPGGVINILTGERTELAPILAEHMDVNGVIDASGDSEIAKTVAEGSGLNVKRTPRWKLSGEEWFGSKAEDPYRILDAVEFKTAWHPAGV
ncbi:MAG: acyl-CoA reductase-like NAD-dependent aldehyde dehydrogenase [Verrucomicrobiales bacterium]|jgi:acyl-CoA reductase-like NAD-dependent aldehyde dehydrogenase